MTIEYLLMKIRNHLQKNKQTALVYWQLFVSGTLFVYGMWTSAVLVKQSMVAHFNVTFYPWTGIFFNPQMSRFLNYVFAASGLAFFYAVFFSDAVITFLLGKSSKIKKETVVPVTVLIILSLALSDYIPLNVRLLVFFSLEIVSLLLLFFPERVFAVSLRFNVDRIFKIIILVFISLLAVEVIPWVKGPVFLMNEYQNLYSQTEQKDGYIDNKVFLDNRLTEVDIEATASFRDINMLEYLHQNITRGQIDHISYIINPLNEYFAGKDTRDIEFQYGRGNTLFLGGIMRICGGLSIDNYYKCYMIYLLYAVIWLFALFYVFRDSAYVCGAFSFYMAAFFSTGFIGFVLAPGIIPSIHMFDALVIPLLFYYFRKQHNWALAGTLSAALLAVFFNLNFGGALFASVFISLMIFSRWCKQKGNRRFFKVVLILSAIFFSALLVFSAGGSHTSFLDNLLGFFSFKPSQSSIVFTLFYFLISYLFLHLIRRRNAPEKHLFVFTFTYMQFLFLYFFWSGLNSHLLHVIQFAGFQFFLMFKIAGNHYEDNNKAALIIKRFVYLCAAAAVVFILVFMGDFYSNSRGFGKSDFRKNFLNHRTYRWDFERARLITTINPRPIKESVSLIHKYSPGKNKGIYIISKYDNILPFLAKRYSKMPSFYLQNYLRDNISTEHAVSLILRDLPEYIYVDSDLEHAMQDPWSFLFKDIAFQKERQSRFGRYKELRMVFEAVKQNYVYADSSGLLTVYKLVNSPKSDNRKARAFDEKNTR